MKLSEFMDAAGSTRMAKRTIDAARLVLVDGIRPAEAARQMRMKRQQVEEAVKRLKAAYRRKQGIPDDWECITVCIPPEPEIVAEIREIEAKAKRRAGLTVD